MAAEPSRRLFGGHAAMQWKFDRIRTAGGTPSRARPALALGSAGVATTAMAQPWHHDYDDDGYRNTDSRLTTSYVDGGMSA